MRHCCGVRSKNQYWHQRNCCSRMRCSRLVDVTLTSPGEKSPPLRYGLLSKMLKPLVYFSHFHSFYVVIAPPTHSVEGPVLFCWLASVVVVCRRRLSSVTLHGGAINSQGAHATAGQSCYVPLGRHLVCLAMVHRLPLQSRHYQCQIPKCHSCVW